MVGENGAGKSTLMKILSGAYTADPGAEISIDGKPVHIDGPLGAKSQGECGINPVAPAVSNALANATGDDPTVAAMAVLLMGLSAILVFAIDRLVGLDRFLELK